MSIPYFQVDAFTGRLFAGNPAGVCLLDAWLPDATMQAIAFENGLAETSFLVPDGDRFALRWFTPAIEVDLCGHATLAAAHVLIRHRGHAAPVLFDTRSGLLTVTTDEDRFILDFPSLPGAEIKPPAGLTEALGATPLRVSKAKDLMAVFPSAGDIIAITPDLAALSRLDCRGVIVTAPGQDCDFVSRFFAPAAGIPEDPVTGSAHCTLAPYWASILGRDRLHARQLSPRGGELFCTLAADRVHIAGRAVTYLEGWLSL